MFDWNWMAVIGMYLLAAGMYLIAISIDDGSLYNPPEEDGGRPKSTTQVPWAPPPPMRTDKNGHVEWPDCPRIPPKKTR